MIGFERQILDNGLRVIVHRDEGTPMVTTNILYDAGSRDEEPDSTGFAHLFEHLMFEGTQNIPLFDVPVMMAGGENNAFTNNDLTNYYITLPATNLETALWLESDRMRGLDLAEERLANQKSVVTEEFRQRYLNQPYGDLLLLLRPLAYRVHPYRWPAIGMDISHIEKADSISAKKFYDRFYTPSNAVLSVAGNVDPDRVFSLAEKWFGDIPSGVKTERKLPVEPEQAERRELTVHRPVHAPHLLMAFHMGSRESRDFYILDLLTDILAGCDSARFPAILVRKKELFSEADIYLSGEADPGLVIFSGRIRDGIDVRKAEEAVRSELDRLASERVIAAELDKARNRYESHRLMQYISVSNKAFSLAYHEVLGDADGINREHEQYMSVTAEEIASAAGLTFRPGNSSVIHYLPEKI
ncbi:MAG TPA: pitrilysin family protein [Bacteroidales bacterium]|nr:pitrilysin family protein [Bacteroidales bacterium]HNX84211.1 pitrilysin family protein [Bacteroidales bacterium]HPS96561.1 pitrilysin family protein [Bacteroidales bacterium]